MRRNVLAGFIGMVLGVILVGFHSPDMVSAGQDKPVARKLVKGIIKENNPQDFFLVDETGSEFHFHTGKQTRYVPNDYRSRKGDEVTVFYQVIAPEEGQEVLSVTQLEIIGPDMKRKEPRNPFVGKLVSLGEKTVEILLQDHPEPKTFGTSRRTVYHPEEWRPAAGDKVRINYVRIPSRWGNYYVYSILRFEKVE
ncbi:hypothetical protein ACFL6N_03725 [Thermodesulfobacteriota bacterium]